jgi:hypothetical protein
MSYLGRSEVRIANRRKVFRSDQSAPMDYFAASLCVLYEDLRIELSACSEASNPRLDILDPIDVKRKDRPAAYCRHYFLRRSIGTPRDVAESLRLMDDCEEFEALRRSFDPEIETISTAAIDFFQSNEPLIQKIRNDVGGHFGTKAATSAVTKFRCRCQKQDRNRLR